MNQRIALLAITLGLLLAGYLDGQDAKLMEAKPITVACVSCAGGVR
jgi:Flp pilus assembly protein protease CpaA